jgi:hypothetical protein
VGTLIVMKRILSVLALVAFGAAPASAANDGLHHWFYNSSNTCAWVTVDVTRIAVPWMNVAAAYVKPGTVHEFVLNAQTPTIKVRAEPTKNKDCSGGKINDLEVRESSTFKTVGNSETTLRSRFDGNGFLITWGR